VAALRQRAPSLRLDVVLANSAPLPP